jgi:prolyl oligopeptidase
MPLPKRLLLLIALVALVRLPVAGADAPDPFLYLEDVYGARAQTWVKAENAKTLGVLQRDPHFAGRYADALRIGEATDRIPAPELIGGRIYNFWRDADHVRGIWRTTTIAAYATPDPAWTTVLDLDALAKAEGKNWVWQGADCTSPSRTRCLIFLSDGGADAYTVREFDLATAQFVPGGFSLPTGKQSVAWLDDDTLLVARAWTPADVTTSGYPYIVKTLARGQSLADAIERFRGTASDVSANPFVVDDGSGHRIAFIARGITTFESETSLLTPAGTVTLALPRKSSIRDLIDDRLIVGLDQAWDVDGRTIPTGALVSLDAAAVVADPHHLHPQVIYAPGPREGLGEAQATRSALLVTWTDNVRGRMAVYAPAPGGAWTKRMVPVPDNTSISLAALDNHESTAYAYVTGFLVPTTLVQIDTANATTSVVKSSPPRFDASHDVVEQHEAVSNDGTRIPYFVVRPKRMRFDGTTPTVLTAYGGFGISETPYYSGTVGKLWLEPGGAWVVANIRGGGEFGPAWHEAGLKTHRQRIYDDFAAVGRDLIARKITSPRRLGIVGGSNGGLLMGVEFEQHPDLWSAVQIEVPLLDMLRYERLEAGSSWTGEYGTVANPAERAFLASISPYQNIKSGVKYPEPFIWTTTKDDRVGPEQARKFAAKLGAMHIPYLFYEVTEGGHGAGANIQETAFTTALGFTYFAQKLMH